jgi:hypothetical protein
MFFAALFRKAISSIWRPPLWGRSMYSIPHDRAITASEADFQAVTRPADSRLHG